MKYGKRSVIRYEFFVNLSVNAFITYRKQDYFPLLVEIYYVNYNLCLIFLASTKDYN